MNVCKTAIGLAALLLLAIGLRADEPHRNFQPLARPKPPTVRAAVRNDIDRFLLGKLEAKRLAFNPEADRAALIRRVAFDLTGLPPTVAELDAFLA
ncbi:MAG TPA: DUF1549 domain-containing protein, partial [Urbifossiella sp.]|nr:DUF1549 domain-containing protein [Urbifossiella sp.]